MQSTLIRSLLKWQEQAHTVPSPDGTYIPVDGAIISPHVEIFRGGTAEGYPFYEAGGIVELCAVVSIAMPNCNPEVRDAPVNRPTVRQEYLWQLATKFAAVCAASQAAGARTLVLPDVGCGVYRNHPEDVGRAFGSVVHGQFSQAFDEIHIVASTQFADAAECTNFPWPLFVSFSKEPAR